MDFVLYSCGLGTFLFDGAMNFIAKSEFKPGEVIENSLKLANGEWLASEQTFLAEYKPRGRVFYLGLKQSKPEGVVFSQDVAKLEVAARYAYGSPDRLVQFNLKLSALQFKGGYSEDFVIIQEIRLIEELERSVNTLAMRIRDYARLYLPERLSMLGDEPTALLKVLDNEPEKELGYPIGEGHRRVLTELGKGVLQLTLHKQRIEEDLNETMKKYCPNLLGVAGALLGARLLDLAGSLRELALMPYSKLQLLGAERAMFRHVRKGTKTPKHGIIVHHPFVASSGNKGKAARQLAERLSHAARIDYFKGPDMSKRLLATLNKAGE